MLKITGISRPSSPLPHVFGLYPHPARRHLELHPGFQRLRSLEHPGPKTPSPPAIIPAACTSSAFVLPFFGRNAGPGRANWQMLNYPWRWPPASGRC